MLFVLMLHFFINKVDNCEFLFHAWYLDQTNLVEDSYEVDKTLDIIQKIGLRLGIELNICKAEIRGENRLSRAMLYQA